MAFVTVEQARAGMVLAEGVVDRRGRLLIPAGNELSERHVQALRTWGITHIEIEGEQPEVDSTSDIAPEIVARAEQDVDEILSANDLNHPFIAALRASAVRRRAVQLTAQGAA